MILFLYVYFAPRQDKKDSKLSIVSMAHSVVGLEGKVGVVVGAGLAMLPVSGLAALGS
jgi:hypothetical protein